MLHIGQLIACTLHEQGRTVTWFARQLCCTRPNVYKIFGKENIDISLLWRISCILHHDFFGDLSQEMKCDVNFSFLLVPERNRDVNQMAIFLSTSWNYSFPFHLLDLPIFAW